jgi:hypothetical protein
MDFTEGPLHDIAVNVELLGVGALTWAGLIALVVVAIVARRRRRRRGLPPAGRFVGGLSFGLVSAIAAVVVGAVLGLLIFAVYLRGGSDDPHAGFTVGNGVVGAIGGLIVGLVFAVLPVGLALAAGAIATRLTPSRRRRALLVLAASAVGASLTLRLILMVWTLPISLGYPVLLALILTGSALAPWRGGFLRRSTVDAVEPGATAGQGRVP